MTSGRHIFSKEPDFKNCSEMFHVFMNANPRYFLNKIIDTGKDKVSIIVRLMNRHQCRLLLELLTKYEKLVNFDNFNGRVYKEILKIEFLSTVLSISQIFIRNDVDFEIISDKKLNDYVDIIKFQHNDVETNELWNKYRYDRFIRLGEYQFVDRYGHEYANHFNAALLWMASPHDFSQYILFILNTGIKIHDSYVILSEVGTVYPFRERPVLRRKPIKISDTGYRQQFVYVINRYMYQRKHVIYNALQKWNIICPNDIFNDIMSYVCETQNNILKIFS